MEMEDHLTSCHWDSPVQLVQETKLFPSSQKKQEFANRQALWRLAIGLFSAVKDIILRISKTMTNDMS